MRIHIYSGNRIEPWDYRNVFEVGIGGSETSHVELAMRLAKRGHEVWSYTDLPTDRKYTSFYWQNVYWADLTDANFANGDLWIIYRQPSVASRLPEGARAWLVCQDVFYPDWRSEDVAKFEKVIGLCPRHLADIAQRDPANAHRLVLSGNGVNVERMIEAEQDAPERVPHRLIWTSSPDRGLKELLEIFQRAKEQVPQLELHIFYGLDNIFKIAGGDRNRRPWKDSFDLEDRARNMPGVTWRGRIGQRALAREILAAGIWCYPTWFPETSCISCMEAQALGAIPITNPIWATGYNVKHGIFIEGLPSDRLVLSRYVDAVVRVASSPAAQEAIRVPMMAEARQRLSWETVADQWDALAMQTEAVHVGA